MKHNKEWYTCDRCGEKIENVIDEIVDFLPEEAQVKIPRKDYLKIVMKEADLSIVEANFNADEESETITIRRVFRKKEETIHLCHKCKKAFERFIKNEQA